MSVHLVADSQGKPSELRAMLAPHFAVTSSLPGDEDIGHGCSTSDLVRILTISDIFAALIEERRYKPPMPSAQGLRNYLRMRGKLEVPLVVAFKEVPLNR